MLAAHRAVGSHLHKGENSLRPGFLTERQTRVPGLWQSRLLRERKGEQNGPQELSKAALHSSQSGFCFLSDPAESFGDAFQKESCPG